MDSTAFFISIILPAFSLIKDRYFQISMILVPVADRKNEIFLPKASRHFLWVLILCYPMASAIYYYLTVGNDFSQTSFIKVPLRFLC